LEEQRLEENKSKSCKRLGSLVKVDMIKIELRNITIRMGDEVVLDDLTIETRQGKRILLAGPERCGKKSILHVLAGIAFPTSGQVFVPGHLRTLYIHHHAHIVKASVYENLVFTCDQPALYQYDRLRKILQMMNCSQSLLDEFEKDIEYAVRHGRRPTLGTDRREDDDLDKAWWARLSESDAVKLHIARGFVANPHVLLLNRPFIFFSTKAMRQRMEDLVDTFVSQRGLALPEVDEAELRARRPRTVFFTTSLQDEVKADVVWHIENKKIAKDKSHGSHAE